MFRGGGLAEWSKALDSKSSVPATVPWVRIPRPPLTVPKCSLVERGASFFEPPPTNALAEARRRETTGGVTEWSKVHDWKSCVPATVPRVRIPPPPLSLMGCPDTPIPVVLPTLAREPRQARKGATVSVSSVWRGLFFLGGPERRPSPHWAERQWGPPPDYGGSRAPRAHSPTPPTGRWGPRGSRFRCAKAGRLSLRCARSRRFASGASLRSLARFAALASGASLRSLRALRCSGRPLASDADPTDGAVRVPRLALSLTRELAAWSWRLDGWKPGEVSSGWRRCGRARGLRRSRWGHRARLERIGTTGRRG